MPTSTLTSKGQITVPLPVRKALGIESGDKLDFVEVEGGYLLVPLRKDVRVLKGRFAGRVRTPVSVEQMNEVIVEATIRRTRIAGKRGRLR